MKLEALEAIHLRLAHAAQQAKADVMREYQVLIYVCASVYVCVCVFVHICACAYVYVFVVVPLYGCMCAYMCAVRMCV